MHRFYLLFVLPLLIQSRQQDISLNEETPIDTIVFDLNTLSSSAITYQLLESSSLLVFNSSTNLITIAKRIDRDTLCPNDDNCSNCYLHMKFYDMFYYDILQLNFRIIDINDNLPIFSSNSYSISLTENNIPGIKIRLSKAEDIDCSINTVQLYELTYVRHGHVMISSINLLHQQNRTSNQPFYLFYDSNSDLYLVINQTLDREVQSEYIFTITANDYVHTISAKIILTVLDVNDHSPRFTQSIYSVNISHSTVPGTILVKLTAEDKDLEHNAKIYYSLLSVDGRNNQNNLFSIDSRTGELRLRSNLTQFDSKKIFKLIIGASDGSENAIPALTTVYINLIPQSLISVTFGSNRISKNASRVYIEENLPNATFIAYISSEEQLHVASDEGFFIQKLSDNSFTLLTDRIYDREVQSSYNVLIRSENSERTFQIIVTDVNDYPPTWNSSLLNVNINSEYMILTLNATDLDQDDNGQVSYRKIGSTWPKWVDLVENRLIINCSNTTDNQCWNDLIPNEIFLEIEAYDHGKIQLSSRVQIRLYHSTTRALFNQFEYLIIGVGSFVGLMVVLLILIVCICCRRKRRRFIKKSNDFLDDHSTKQKIIQTSSSSEQSSSAGSLYGSEKSDNITLETATSCHLDMFLFSPKRMNLHVDSSYPYSFVNKSAVPNDNLTNRLFHSIQNDLTLLTEGKQEVIANRGTYV